MPILCHLVFCVFMAASRYRRQSRRPKARSPLHLRVGLGGANNPDEVIQTRRLAVVLAATNRRFVDLHISQSCCRPRRSHSECSPIASYLISKPLRTLSRKALSPTTSALSNLVSSQHESRPEGPLTSRRFFFVNLISPSVFRGFALHCYPKLVRIEMQNAERSDFFLESVALLFTPTPGKKREHKNNPIKYFKGGGHVICCCGQWGARRASSRPPRPVRNEAHLQRRL
jgi:hypothetical protein